MEKEEMIELYNKDKEFFERNIENNKWYVFNCWLSEKLGLLEDIQDLKAENERILSKYESNEKELNRLQKENEELKKLNWSLQLDNDLLQLGIK